MADQDALASMELKTTGLFVKVKEGEPQTLRILTLDPLVSRDQWGNTRYSFIVWNWTAEKAQILSKGPGIVKQLQAIHLDEDFEALNKVDIKLIATGEGLETRYTVQVLPKAKELTPDMIKEAQTLKLEDKIDNGIRLSAINEGEELPTERSLGDEYRARHKDAPENIEPPTEDIDLSEIPF